RGRGRAGARGNPMEGLSPEIAAAMAAAMRGETRGPTGRAGVTGSAWESGKGWILKLTVTGTASTSGSAEDGSRRQSSTYSAKYVASIPLNYGTPAVGVPGGPGPMWTLLTTDSGSPEALATPLTLSVE